MRTRVYLAKSNKANPDIIINVRHELSKYDIDVVEYSGGIYKSNDLLSCNHLIIIPCVENVTLGEINTEILVGKGLYNQILEFHNRKPDCRTNINIVIDNKLNLGCFDEQWVEDSDNYVDYGIVTTEGSKSFDAFLSSKFKKTLEKNTDVKGINMNHLTIKL